MKITFYAFILSYLVLNLVACKNTEDEPAPFGTVDFSYAFKAGSQNTVNFIGTVTGTYELLEWTFGENKTIQDVKQTEYYFPFKGSYKVTLSIWSKGKSIAVTKTIEIPINDPNYNGPALVWSDEFDGNELNSSNWTPETNIRFNNELQTYQATGNHFVSGGYLTITAQKVDENKQFGSYTSARLMSYVDDRTKPYFTYSPDPQTSADWPFNQPFFFILNVAIGGNWGGAQGIDNSIFPVSMVIDYVRVYAPV